MSDLRVISLGAGVQSSTLLLMCLCGEHERPDAAIFADTGWEPQAVYDHLERLKAECEKNKFPLYTVSRGNLRDDLIGHIEGYHNGGKKRSSVGQPPFMVINREGQDDLPPVSGGRLWRQCTKEYKIELIQKQTRTLLGYQKGERVKKTVESWQGISLDEAHRMKDSRVKWITNRYPLVEMRMDRNNCKKWLERHGWWAPKSSCIGCPYHSNKYWREMKVHRPWEWEDAVAFDHALRKQPYPGVTGTVYLHRDMVPLDEVDLDSAEDRGQGDMFGEECEGLCGV